MSRNRIDPGAIVVLAALLVVEIEQTGPRLFDGGGMDGLEEEERGHKQ
jgi:hypothetical protein